MIKFRIRYRPFQVDYPPKTYYAVNFHSVDVVDGKEKSGGFLGLLRMTDKEFTVFRDLLDTGTAPGAPPKAEFIEVE